MAFFIVSDPGRTGWYQVGRTRYLANRLRSLRCSCPNVKLCRYIVDIADSDVLAEALQHQLRPYRKIDDWIFLGEQGFAWINQCFDRAGSATKSSAFLSVF